MLSLEEIKDWAESIEWLAFAAGVVSVNTGVMHVAAALGTPTIALNGPTSGTRWGPRGRFTRCVASPIYDEHAETLGAISLAGPSVSITRSGPSSTHALRVVSKCSRTPGARRGRSGNAGARASGIGAFRHEGAGWDQPWRDI